MNSVIPPRVTPSLGSSQELRNPQALLRVDRKERRRLEMDAPRFLVMSKPITFAKLLCDLP